MESYLKEEEPVDFEWLKNNLGWLDKVPNNKLLNLSAVRNACLDHSNFRQVIHLPDSKEEYDSLEIVLEKFIEECNDDLNYFLSLEIDNKEKTINIFVLPIVESA